MTGSEKSGRAGAFVCGVGLATPVGDSAAQTSTSVRAGICRYALSRFHNRHYKAMKLALIPDGALPPLPPTASGLTPRQERLVRLSAMALPEALASLPDGRSAPLFLAGPEALFGLPSPTNDVLRNHVVALGGARISPAAGGLFASGRAGGLAALGAALEFLAQGKFEYALVGGVDTFLDDALLAALDRDDRVLAEGVLDGFAPGEAAGFVLLASDSARARAHRSARVGVHAPGFADEPGHRFSQEPYLGEGLANAVAAALEGGKGPYGTVLSTMNGESFCAKEWGTAAIRNANALGTQWTMLHPADCFGDIGAAFGPALVGLAAHGLSQQTMKGPCLVYCSSELAARAAVRITLED